MTRIRVLRGIVALAATLIILLLVVTSESSPQQKAGKKAQRPATSGRPEGQPISMPSNLVGLEISLGLKDAKPARWNGSVELSAGRVIAVDIAQGDADAKAEGNRFTVRSVRRMMMKQETIEHAVLRVNLDAPPATNVTIKTEQGAFQFALSDLANGISKEFLDGRALVERQDGAVRLTGRETEDDFPAMAKGRDGTVWLVYVAYQPGLPIINERVQAGGFESLVTTGNGDRIRLMRFDGKVWQPPMDVTESGLDIWRPAVAVDGKGDVVVAWSQQVDGDWEIFYRRYTPAADASNPGTWSDFVRLTRATGADFHVVAATDSSGVVWLAWQAWRKDNFDIMLAALGHPWKEPRPISNSKANDWCPAIAADSKGDVYVAWDTYDQGNYDVKLHRVGKEPKAWTVAGSPKFEARPHIVCDAKDRVWIAYESGDEQWGKDYSTD